MLMMMRADDSYSPDSTEGCTAEELLACITADDYDACIAACSEAEEEEPTDPEEVKAGTLNVTMTSEEGGEFPGGVSSLPIAKYTLKAVDEDINITSLVIEEGGYALGNNLNAALFIDGARVSKIKAINGVDKETTLSLSSDYTVKAGKSVDIELRVSDNRIAVANMPTDQFNIKLDAVNCSAEKVKLPSNVKSNTFKLVSTPTVQLTVIPRNKLDAPKAGTKNAELFEFQLQGSTAQDITLNSITLLGSTKDIAEYFDNFELTLDGEVLANGTMNGKYLTFVLKNGYTFDKNKTATKTFTVKADANGGAGKGNFNFVVENSIDIDATANGYNAPVQVVNGTPKLIDNTTPATSAKFSDFSVSAGRVTIERENPKTTTFVKNQSNVYLGSFTINDNNGSDLSLTGFELTLNEKQPAYAMSNYLDTIKVRYGSTTAGLVEAEKSAGGVYTFEDEKTIGKSLTVYVYATLQNNKEVVSPAKKAGSFQMELSSIGLVENQNDTPVTDKSMPNLWISMKGSASNITLSPVTLGAKSVAKGTTDIDAVSFKVKTNETYGVKLQKLTFVASDDDYGTCSDTTITTKAACVAPDEWTPINNNTIRRAVLVAGDNEYSATVAAGEIRVTNANIVLDPDTTTTFTLKVDLAGNPTVEEFAYKLDSYEGEDTSEDRNEMKANSITTIPGRVITVQGEGKLTISMENTENNKYAKSILAGTDAIVAEYSLQAKYETLNANTIVLTFSDDISPRVTDIELLYGTAVIASSPVIDATAKTATFTNVNFDISLTKTPLSVKLITNAINEDNGQDVLKNITLDNISLDEVVGNDTGNPIDGDTSTPAVVDPISYNTNIVREFDVVPATIVASVAEKTNTSTKLILTVNKGENVDANGDTIKVYLNNVDATIVSNGGLAKVTVYNAGQLLATATSTDNADWSEANVTWTPNSNNLIDWELSAGENEITINYMPDNVTNPSYTADLTNVKYVASNAVDTVYNSTPAANVLLNGAPRFNNRMKTSLNLVTR